MLPAVLLLPVLVLLPTPALAPADGLVVEGVVLVDGLVLCGAVLPMVELLLLLGSVVEVPVVELVLPATLPVLEPVALVSLWGTAAPLDPDCGVELELADAPWSDEAVELVLPAALLFSPLALGVVAAAPALVGALLWLATEASTFSLSLTLRTPGMASAIFTARLRSSSEATLPFSLTSPLFLTLTLTLENAGSVAN